MPGQIEALQQAQAFGHRCRRAPRLEKRAVTSAAMERGQHVVQHRQVHAQLRNLKRPGHAPVRDLARCQRGDVFTVQHDLPRRRLQVAGDHVDEGCLASTVAADQAHSLAVGNVNGNVSRCDYRAKAAVETFRR